MLKRICTFLIITILLVSCGSRGKTYRIGVDPSWYPANLGGKEANIYAFSSELLRAISHEEGVFFETVAMSWDNLIQGLKEKKYEGILNSMTPRVFLERTYSFSEPFVHLGPVLVVREGVRVSSMKHLKGKEIGVDSIANEALLIEKYPGVLVHYYDTIPEGLDEVLTKSLDGALVGYLQATSYIRDLYYGQIKIITPPLDDAGLRLLTLNGDNEELIKVFNRGLEKLQDNGAYEKLLKKWELY